MLRLKHLYYMCPALRTAVPCRVSLLFALSEAVPQRVGGFTPQGVCLTLGGFQTFHHKPSQHVMNCLAETLHRMLPLFTRSEVASCLEAFSSLGYQPPDHVIAVSFSLSSLRAPPNLLILSPLHFIFLLMARRDARSTFSVTRRLQTGSACIYVSLSELCFVVLT